MTVLATLMDLIENPHLPTLRGIEKTQDDSSNVTHGRLYYNLPSGKIQITVGLVDNEVDVTYYMLRTGGWWQRGIIVWKDPRMGIPSDLQYYIGRAMERRKRYTLFGGLVNKVHQLFSVSPDKK